MGINPNMAEIAALLGETSRATILASMMDGRFHTASELAYMAAIKPQTASFHLAKLVEGKLIKVEKQGRHRYFQLAGEDIAQFLESFLAISPPPEVRSLKQSSQIKLLQDARTCYDHLAGKLGVQLTESMLKAGYLTLEGKQFVLTDEGILFFTTFGIDLTALKRKRRSFSHACLDWSERRYHLAGALGCELLNQFFNLGWLLRVPSIRAIKVTEKGKIGFKEVFHLDL
ncbi:ArsR/SmtB family transcription factor [Lysinibacillus capsici]|uniref:Helix-turn-helix domain-containing protein n=1 Tax=Lysinibacillus capsici TaxID=2115968 RepID=A0ABY8KKI2_9BACI|nr:MULTISPECIES: helix-turn-helix domain-containing protein [Lysinibacillus]MCM0626153.1 helix-turn-helix domain-containing protein [Lysinibacillus sp. OL1_EC]MCR6521835.1 helix-turn-helix domain-containing protein [Lysinibacillus capsici]MCS5501505.1 helix-turn-helix domain-containing protein [Lysinibacillus sp. A4]MCT1541473.1 helix-turn-helix domain-containing protein [Lysinibacillus capsici]MCT1572803.1 helix-turn-helix domain-containing protein [Lysinibacillus capsici]